MVPRDPDQWPHSGEREAAVARGHLDGFVVAVGLYLAGRDARIGRVARWLWVLLLLVIAVKAVAVLVGNLPFTWGSYELTFEEVEESNRYPAAVSTAGATQAMGSLIGTLLLVPVGIAMVRAGRMPWWAVRRR